MQGFVHDGRLVLDLSQYDMHYYNNVHLVPFETGSPLWPRLMKLSGLHLNLDNTHVTDSFALGMVHAIDTLLATDQTVAWRELKLRMYHTFITDEGQI